MFSSGVSVGDRWEGVRELVRPYVTDHRLIFHDYHLLLGCLGLKDKELTATLMDSLQEFVKYVQCIDSLVQGCSNFIANTLELLQSYTKPSICPIKHTHGCVELCCAVAVSTRVRGLL